MSVALDAARNPLLGEILSGLMPCFRRIQFRAFSLRLDDLTSYAGLFHALVESLETRDIERGEESLRRYLMQEREFVLRHLEGGS